VFFVAAEATAFWLGVAAYWIRMFGITGGYHRYFSHRSYSTSRVFQFVLAWLGCSAMQKGPLWWAAHHRDHHKYSDGPLDPHSPITTNFLWSHVGWVLSDEYVETNWRRVKDWTRYPELRWLNSWHWVPGICWAVVCWLIAGWSGLVWGFFVSTVLLYHGTFLVNSVCHIFGHRRYPTKDASRNNLVVALLTCGEGWHNNHHFYPASVNQGFHWWEIDASYCVLRMLSWVGIVWKLRKPPAERIAVPSVVPLAKPSWDMTLPQGQPAVAAVVDDAPAAAI
jgi:stearoyl-CoA desaturase (delta-9 desaturase)